MKKHDVWLGIIVLLLAVGIWLIQYGVIRSEGSVIVVTQDGEQIGTYRLSEDNQIEFTDEQGRRNLLEIRDGKAKMCEADCPDRLCVKQKAISYKGESIICLPHRLVIEVTEGETNTVDAIVG